MISVNIKDMDVSEDVVNRLAKKGIHNTSGLYKLDLTKLSKSEITSLCIGLIDLLDRIEAEVKS